MVRRALGAVLVAVLGLCMQGSVEAEGLLALAERFAPVLRQDTASTEDYITRFDFDGNWAGDDNWDNHPKFPQTAWVYWAGIETGTHVFLTYAFFHPRDWTVVNNPILSHENDLEGALVVLEKGEAGPQLVAIETVSHFDFLRYQVEGGYPVVKGDGTLRREGERPVLFIEAKGHGVSAWDGSEFPGGDGVVYRLGAEAEVPASANDRQVSYRLLDIESSFWARRFEVGEGQTFGKAADFGGETYGYALLGRRYGDDKANAPWGWAAEGLPRGTFFLDPARMVREHYRVPEGFSQSYLDNPFTGDSASRGVRARALFDGLHEAAD